MNKYDLMTFFLGSIGIVAGIITGILYFIQKRDQEKARKIK